MIRMSLIVGFSLLFCTTIVMALGVLERESCIYNGKKLDRGIAEETDTKTPKVAEDFTGTAVCYDLRDNRRVGEIQIKNGVKNGLERKFDRRNGKLLEEIHHLDGKRHGIMKRYDHRNGGLQQEYNYQQGDNLGIQKSYYSENQQLKRIYWVAKERTKDRKTEINFNEDGSLSMLACGPQVLSTLDSRWCGRDGNRNEVVLYTHSNGQTWPREIRHYRSNLLDGEVVRLHKDGHMMKKEVYDNGERISAESFADGKPVHIKTYETGKESGEEIAYFPGTDQVKVATEWQHSKKLKQLEFYQNGNPKEVRLYKEGVVAITRYYDDGSKYLVGDFVERTSRWWSHMVRHGEVKVYSTDGRIREEAAYDYGQLAGVRKLYDEKVGLYREEFYEKGSLLCAKDIGRSGRAVRETHYHADGSVKKVDEFERGL